MSHESLVWGSFNKWHLKGSVVANMDWWHAHGGAFWHGSGQHLQSQIGKSFNQILSKRSMYSIGLMVLCFKMKHMDHIRLFMDKARLIKCIIATKLNGNWDNVATAIMLRKFLLFFIGFSEFFHYIYVVDLLFLL